MDMKAELWKLLNQYCNSEGIPKQCGIRDILTDAMHICDDLGIDFNRQVNLAEDVYFEEIEESNAEG